MKRLSKAGLIVGVLFAFAATCSIANADVDASQPAEQGDLFTKGNKTLEDYFSYAAQPTGTREQLYANTLGLGYCFMRHNSVTIELTGMQACQPVQNVQAVGFDLLLRTSVISKKNWNLFADFGAGMFQANGPIPPSGTNFNFTFKAGLGGTVLLWGQTYLLTGIRYEHLSNARIYGADKNPSLNAIQGYIGLLFKL